MIVLEGFDPAMLLTSNQRLHWAKKAAATAYWRGLGVTAGCRVEPRDQARIVFHIRFPNNIRRDVGNLSPTAKALVDGLVDAGVLPDDSDAHLEGPDLRRDYPNGPHRISIDIQEAARG